MTTLEDVAGVPEVLDSLLEQSGTTSRMFRMEAPESAYTWRTYSDEEYARGVVRENILSALQCVSRQMKTLGQIWMNPGGLSYSEKNTILIRGFIDDLVSYESDSNDVSMMYDTDSE